MSGQRPTVVRLGDIGHKTGTDNGRGGAAPDPPEKSLGTVLEEVGLSVSDLARDDLSSVVIRVLLVAITLLFAAGVLWLAIIVATAAQPPVTPM